MLSKEQIEKLMRKFNRRHTAKYPVVYNGAVIQFVKEYSFLSNFYPVEVEMHGVVFPTVENAYQAMKLPKEHWKYFVDIMPGEAKKLSRKLVAQYPEVEEHYWRFDIQKVAVMKLLLLQKFEKPEFREKLLQTESLLLIEGNTWGDTFWGVDLKKPQEDSIWMFEGNNTLGQLLMEIRQEMKEGGMK